MKISISTGIIFTVLAFSVPTLASETTKFICDNGENFKIAYPDDDTAIMEYHDELLMLKNVISASGARYIGEGWQWWGRGLDNGELSVLIGDETIASSQGTECILDDEKRY